MSVWQTFRDTLQDSMTAASEKASELIKSGTEAVKETAEKTGERAANLARLAQLKFTHREIEKQMATEFGKLGETYFRLRTENRLAAFEQEAGEVLSALSGLQKELLDNDNEKKELAVTGTLHQKDYDEIEKLAKELVSHGGRLVHVTLHKDSAFTGKRIADITLPRETLFGTILRAGEVVIPRGDTVLQAGDDISLLGKSEEVEQAVRMLAG